jgi:hypothetical protein
VAARKLCWDQQLAPAALRVAAAEPLSPRPVAAAVQPEAELVWVQPAVELVRVQRQPLLRLAASNRAAARTPCWDRTASVRQAAVAAAPSLLRAARQAAQALRPVQRAQVEAAVVPRRP